MRFDILVFVVIHSTSVVWCKATLTGVNIMDSELVCYVLQITAWIVLFTLPFALVETDWYED